MSAINHLRLWLAIKLLGFMAPNTCLVRACRYDGSVEWDGGKLLTGTTVTPIGLGGLLENAGGL